MKIEITENPFNYPFFTVGKQYDVIRQDSTNIFVTADDGTEQFIGIPETNPDSVKYKEVTMKYKIGDEVMSDLYGPVWEGEKLYVVGFEGSGYMCSPFDSLYPEHDCLNGSLFFHEENLQPWVETEDKPVQMHPDVAYQPVKDFLEDNGMSLVSLHFLTQDGNEFRGES